MSTRPWWAHVLQWGAWFAIMSLVTGWMARSRLRSSSHTQPNALEYPRSVLVLGLVCGGFFLALAALSFLFPGKTGSPLISLLFLGFSLMGVGVIAEYVRVRHELEPGGLRYKTLLGKRGFLSWAEVTHIRYSVLAKWFRIDAAGGEVIRVSAMSTSLPEFARAVLDGVSRERIDAEAVGVLEATASGSPPSVWG